MGGGGGLGTESLVFYRASISVTSLILCPLQPLLSHGSYFLPLPLQELTNTNLLKHALITLQKSPDVAADSCSECMDSCSPVIGLLNGHPSQ